MNLKLLIGLALLSSLGTAHAESLPELQSRCGNDAVALLARQRQLDEDLLTAEARAKTNTAYDYEHHYSESMKGCFVVIEDVETWSMPDPNKTRTYLHTATRYRLFDVNAHHEIGRFDKVRTNHTDHKPGGFQKSIGCNFGGVECSGEAEWRAKAAPYIPGWRN